MARAGSTRTDALSGSARLAPGRFVERLAIAPRPPSGTVTRDRTWRDWLAQQQAAGRAALEKRHRAMESHPDRTGGRVGSAAGIGVLSPTSPPFAIGDALDLPYAVFPLVSADFDHDGRPDFAGVAIAADRVLIAINDTAGFLFDSVAVASPIGIACGDLDGDGHVDLAVLCSQAPAHVVVFRGRGDGGFDAVASYPAGNQPQSVVAGDLDGDGRADLVVSRAGDDSIAVYVRVASDSMAVRAFPAAAGPADLALGDFDHDGRLDVAVSHLDASEIAIYHNLGAGVLADRVEYDGGYQAGLAAADLDGDGWTDLVAAAGYGGRLLLYWNDGLGAFGTRDEYAIRDHSEHGSVAIGDLDGDGRRDIVALGFQGLQEESWAHTFFQRADHTFDGSLAYFTATSYRARSYGSVVLADVDGFQGLDLVTTGATSYGPNTGDGALLVMHHIAGRGFAGMADYALTGDRAIAQAVDFERRGVSDLVVDEGTIVHRMRAMHVGTFDPPMPMPEAAGAIAIDLSGDGRSDLLTPSGSSFTVRLTASDGTPGAPVAYDLVGAYVTAADFDGDGSPDALVRGAGDSLAVLLNDGAGAFGARHALDIGTPPAATLPIAAGHLNDDGRSDLAIGKLSESGEVDSVLVLRSDASFAFTRMGVFPVAACPLFMCAPHMERLAIADLDGDGARDVVVFSEGPEHVGLVTVLLNTGGGALGAATGYTTPGEDPVYLLIDVTGDARPDLASVSYDDLAVGRLWIAPNAGDGTFAPATLITTPNLPRSLTSADFDGDGLPDLAVGYQGFVEPPGVVVLLNRSPDPTTLAVALLERSIVGGRVRLSWSYGALAAGGARVERRAPPSTWETLGAARLENWRLTYEDATARAGESYQYRLVIGAGAAAHYSEVVEIEIPADRVAFDRVFPNPASRELLARFALAGEEPASLTLIDLAGRRVMRLAIDRPALGMGSAKLSGFERVAPGVYWLRLSQGRRVATTRVVVAR